MYLIKHILPCKFKVEVFLLPIQLSCSKQKALGNNCLCIYVPVVISEMYLHLISKT